MAAASVWNSLPETVYVHRRHYQFSTEDWRLNFLSGLTAVLPHERLTVVTTTWPHIRGLLFRVLAVLGLCATSSQFVIIIIIIRGGVGKSVLTTTFPRFLARDSMACMLNALYAIARPSVCPSVRPFATRMDQLKTFVGRIMQFSPYGSPIPLVFAG